MNTTLSLREFQKLSGISDRTLVRLLVSGSLPCVINAAGGVELDLNRFELSSFQNTLHSVLNAADDDEQVLFAEEIAAIVERELGLILDEAVSVLLSERWEKEEKPAGTSGA